MAVLIFLAVWLGCGAWAASIMDNKGRSKGTGWVLGLILGIFGVIIAAMMGRDHVQLAKDGRQALPGAYSPPPIQAFTPPPPSNTAELERLAKLHTDGRLTDDEYARAKAKLLGL